MRYEQFRNRIRKGIKPARVMPHVVPQTYSKEITRMLQHHLTEPPQVQDAEAGYPGEEASFRFKEIPETDSN